MNVDDRQHYGSTRQPYGSTGQHSGRKNRGFGSILSRKGQHRSGFEIGLTTCAPNEIRSSRVPLNKKLTNRAPKRVFPEETDQDSDHRHREHGSKSASDRSVSTGLASIWDVLRTISAPSAGVVLTETRTRPLGPNRSYRPLKRCPALAKTFIDRGRTASSARGRRHDHFEIRHPQPSARDTARA